MINNIDLARPQGGLASYYPALVVGSGCGGAVAASRLARTGQRVCVLTRAERAEVVPGLPQQAGTLAQSYLADARAHCVEVFTCIEVRAVLPAHPDAPGRWRIAFQLLGHGRDAFGAPELALHAGDVILAAGVPGTGEILLRSRARGLPRSARVGPVVGGMTAGEPTVRAMTARAIARLAHERAWRIDDTIPFEPDATTEPPERPSLHFTERMRGYLIEKRGGRRSALAFVLTLVSDDLPAMFTDPDHVARLAGTVEAPALSPEPLTAHGHCSQLLHRDPDGARRMHYRLTMHGVEGHVYCLDGIKQIHAPPDLWSDTTDLAYTLHHGPDPHGRVLGQGHLSLALPDLARQLTTMDVTGVPDPAQRHGYLTSCLRFFGHALLETYLEPVNDSEPGTSAA